MATTKNTPGTKTTEQRGNDTTFGKNGGSLSNTGSGDRTMSEEGRNAGALKKQGMGADSTRTGMSERNGAASSELDTTEDERNDREAGAARTTGQNISGTRDTNEGDVRSEDEEDVDLDTDEATDLDESTDDDDDRTASKD